jgi:hypothetical protein
MEHISIALVVAYFLLIWFRTDAVVEYCNLLKLSFLFKQKEYNELQLQGYGGNYIDFLHEYYKDYFLVRLFACPVCLSFWCGLTISLLTNNVFYFLIAPLALFFYTILNKLL